jgi:5-methylthioribose kinase
MTVTSGQILTAETVPACLMERFDAWETVASKLGITKDTTLTATAILGGNVNYAFCVTWTHTTTTTATTAATTIFVKQAPEFVAIFGPDGFPLTSDRMQKEMNVYSEWKALLGESLARQYLPEIYMFDSEFLFGRCDV